MKKYRIDTRQTQESPPKRLHFVVLEKGRELAPVFDHYNTALEVGEKYCRGERFFDNIPTVPFNTPYPRPDPC